MAAVAARMGCQPRYSRPPPGRPGQADREARRRADDINLQPAGPLNPTIVDSAVRTASLGPHAQSGLPEGLRRGEAPVARGGRPAQPQPVGEGTACGQPPSFNDNRLSPSAPKLVPCLCSGLPPRLLAVRPQSRRRERGVSQPLPAAHKVQAHRSPRRHRPRRLGNSLRSRVCRSGPAISGRGAERSTCLGRSPSTRRRPFRPQSPQQHPERRPLKAASQWLLRRPTAVSGRVVRSGL